MTLREHIAQALAKKVAIGHFNISTLDGVWAVADAAYALKVPVIIGVSEGERDYVGVNEIAAVVKSIREHRGQPIFLNADHTYSFERVKEAIDAGFDSVIFLMGAGDGLVVSGITIGEGGIGFCNSTLKMSGILLWTSNLKLGRTKSLRWN